jgi:hypothetical protein
VGTFVGLEVGGTVGAFVGLEVGGTVGAFIGLVVGGTVGAFVGLAVLGLEVMGARVGLSVGADVTISHSPIAPCSEKNGHQYEVSGSLARSQTARCIRKPGNE